MSERFKREKNVDVGKLSQKIFDQRTQGMSEEEKQKYSEDLANSILEMQLENIRKIEEKNNAATDEEKARRTR